ncbi:acyltransferase family protein [Stenotrophomonas sp. HITSZ_GD]|uniref:acyltransferase family protein n=1 Tax=Stenotrophomonas sp. HITSZ_GD TaxID=3037248 RepID=UPI00240D4D86|nr:acyltransferase family protein [Stenotrophomonas sp. HITSZ_GD]MDG2524677.1 acyltransferase family protein [Stenotrophomonas sp. HITSZ_GD]
MNAAAATRDGRIDATRAIAIVLVVLGHAKGVPQAYTLLAFSFHVPLFFFLSGWVGAAYGRPRSDAQTWAKLVRGLVVPYVFFFFVAYAYWLATRHIGTKAARWGALPWWDPLVGGAQGTGEGLYVQPALWFLPALFVTALAFHYVGKRAPAMLLAAVMAVVACLWCAWFPGQGVRLPWGLDVLPVSLFFFAAGAAVARHAAAAQPHPALRWWGMPLLLAVLWLPLAWINGKVDVNLLRFGQSPAVFLGVALLGTALMLHVGGWIQHVPGVQWIGRNTLVILCTHFLVLFFLSGVRSVAGIGGPPGPAWALFATAVAIAAAVPARAMLARWAPWALGLSPTAMYRKPVPAAPEVGSQ